MKFLLLIDVALMVPSRMSASTCLFAAHVTRQRREVEEPSLKLIEDMMVGEFCFFCALWFEMWDVFKGCISLSTSPRSDLFFLHKKTSMFEGLFNWPIKDSVVG